jgi:hypothetical protein
VRHFITAVLRVSRAQWPVLVATLIVVALCIFAEPLYRENDDCFLVMAGAGFGVAAHPEPYLVFSHFGYGLILVALSRLIGLNAHGWVTIFSIWLSLVLIIRASLRARNLPILWTFLSLNIGCIFLGALLSAEFTITAGLLFSAATLSWLASTEDERRSSFLRSVLILALILSYLIRPESFQMGLVIALPLLLFLWLGRTNLSGRSRSLVFASVIIAVLAFATDKIAYWMSADWRGVPEYNDLRAQFVDYHRVPWNPEAPEYRQVGWTYNDYAMFNLWYMRAPIYDGQNLALLIDKLGIPLPTTAIAQIRDWFVYPFSSWPLLLILAAQVPVYLLLIKERRWAGLLVIFGEGAAISAAGITGREPLDYVWTAAASMSLMILCGLLIVNTPAKTSRIQNLGLSLGSLFGLVTGIVILAEHFGDCRDAAAYRSWINQNSRYLQGKVTVWDTGLVWQWLVTPTRIHWPFPGLKVASIDDINRMPIETAMLSELGIDDLAKDLCTDPEMHIITNIGHTDVLAPFCQQHYGITPVFKEVARWRYTGIYVLDHPKSPADSSQ